MNQKIIKFTLIFLIIVLSMFVGHKLTKNKNQIIGFYNKVSKIYERYYFSTLEKIGLKKIGKKIDTNKIITHEENKFTKTKGNSFSVIFSKIKSYPGRTASIILSENEEVEYEIFTQDGFIIKKDNIYEINFPSLFYSSTGVRSVFTIKDEYFALSGFSTYSCKYASVFKISNGKNLIKSKCLPDIKNVNFDGLGGAYVKTEDGILLTIGAPMTTSEEISQLSQSKESIFGKIILIKNKNLLNYDNKKINYDIFSLGHRNPQGLTKYEDDIFSLEHGPQGGDELSKIVEGGNYGWPLSSFGTKYADGTSYVKNLNYPQYNEPIFAFLPAVAPSALSECPKNLSEYYKPYGCLMGLSLKERSILILILDKNNSKVIIFEKINLGGRLRHFGLNKSAKLFVDSNGYFYVSMDKDGLYKIKFEDFR